MRADPPTDVILRRYLLDGRLASMPRPGRKRRIVLEHVVRCFEPGHRYVEVDVNLALRQLWPDVAALRRYLVDEQLLARADGLYWRVDTPPDAHPDTHGDGR